jgi:biotin carboxyl carrier protein
MTKQHIRLDTGDTGKTYTAEIDHQGRVTLDGDEVPVNLHELQPGVLSLLLTLPDGTTRSFRAMADQDAVIVNGTRIPYTVSDPRSLRAASALAGGDTGPRPLKAPMPGRIVRVLVAVGDTVAAGQGCVVIEAMKMQNELKAPRAGTVTRLTAVPGDTVPPGTTLLVIE